MLNKINRLLVSFGERQDILFALFLLLVVFMLIIPLPTSLVDILIAFNISISVLLLLATLYLSSPLDFSSFPSVLLVTTLFRLSLSISTTRLILLQADAGHIIQAFGEFVVGGNVVVGLVIFLILAIVQFIVITKGAERVAEVSARFSLDALPGKQLSIDADMRAGVINLDQAREQRKRLQMESKLYGSMDGAMKFVKGDAISSLIIVFVNLLGGLTIGVLQKGYSFGEAIHVYSILSIGDGLISQIPALFISITAGIMVTRVGDDSKDANLGRDISKQILAEPKALGLASLMLLLMSFLPGFPRGIFLALAALFGFPSFFPLIVSFVKKRKKSKNLNIEDETPHENMPAPLQSSSEEKDFDVAQDSVFAPTILLMVEFSEGYQDIADMNTIINTVNQVRISLYYRLGVPLPPIQTRVNPKYRPVRYTVFVGEIPVADGLLKPKFLYLCEKEDQLNRMSIDYQEDVPIFTKEKKSLWSPISQEEHLEKSGMAYERPLELLKRHCETVIARNASLFIGIQETRFLLSKMEVDYPDLVKEVQRICSLQTLAELLRRLLQEYVSIRDLRQVFGAVVEWGGRESDPVMLVEHLRSALNRQITYQYSTDLNMLPVFLLEAELEDIVRNGIRQTSSASYISLDPEISKRIVSSVQHTIEENSNIEGGKMHVVLTAMDIRRYVRRLLEQALPEVVVLSYQEINPGITIQPLGKVSLEENFDN